MLLPLSHEQRTVRRLPWVTFAIMALCLVAFLATKETSNRVGERFITEMEQALDFFSQHQYLELKPGILSLIGVPQEAYDEHRRTVSIPDNKDLVQRQQEQLDAMFAEAYLELEKDPSRIYGLVPARATILGWFGYMFMHAGWLHLLGNMFFLYISGPFLEDVWGRPLYAVFYILAGLASALVFVAHYPDLQGPLVGASGAVNGVLAAFLLRYWNTKIKFLAWIGVPFVFTARAWFMLPIFFLRELISAQIGDSVAPGVGSGVAYWAHVGGFGFGLLVALAMRQLKIEERFLDRAIEAKVTLLDNSAVEQAVQLHHDRRTGEALALLEELLRSDPDNVDAAAAFWNIAADSGQPQRAAPALLRCLRKAATEGDTELVLAHWDEILRAADSFSVEPALAVRVAELMLAQGAIQDILPTVDLALDGLPRQPAAGLVVRLARLAVEVGSRRAGELAAHISNNPEIPLETRLELEARLHAMGLAAQPQATAAPPAPVPPAEAVAAPPGAALRRLQVMQATPVEIDGAVLRLSTAGSFPNLPMDTIKAVAVAGLRPPDRRPFLIIDLLLDHPDHAGSTLRLIRMLSNAYDPRRLVGGDNGPQAFKQLIQTILSASGALPLPDAAAAQGNPYSMFPTLEAYEAKVLQGRSEPETGIP